MKTILKYFGISIFVIGALFACKESFLDGPAQGVLDESVLGDQNGVEGNLIAAYSLLDGWATYGDWGGAGSNWPLASITTDDAYKGSEPGDQQPLQDLELYQWSTGGADGYINSKWRNVYDGINRCNATINLLNSVEGISQSDQDRIRGEALFLRAHYHFDAYKIWGNIPYYTEMDEDFRKPNTDVDAYPLILADLDQAITLLPESQSDVGRVNKWTAKAYRGMVMLHRIDNPDYAGALSFLQDVVGNGPYELEDNFHNVFDVAYDNGPETVLAYQASSNDGNGNGDNGNRNDRLNFPHSGSPFGCCGFHQPSQNLVNAYKVDGNGLPFLDGSSNNTDVVPTDPIDPRVDWTVGRDDVPFLDWGLHAPGWIRDRAWAGPYSPKKNIYHKESGVGSSVGWASYQLHSMNMHILRYADVMLMLAECEVEAGTIDNARTLVNEIRTRAAQGAQGPDGGDVVVDIDDAGITWANYQIGTYTTAWTDQATARAAVRMERRLELAMEGHRLFDLRRWGVAADVLNSYIAVEKTRRAYLTAASTYEARHRLFPLPTTQIELSRVQGEDRLVQNSGW